MYLNKKIVMCGCHEAGIKLVEFLIQQGITFDYFVTLSEEQAVRYEVSGYYDYRKTAKEYNIPVYVPEKYDLKSERDQAFFAEQNFDILIQGGWQRLFPDAVLKTFSIGAIGIHGSPDFLPKGRGRSPLNWSLIQNKKRFILSAFLMKPGADDGDVFATTSFDITGYDDIKTLYYKVAICSKRLIWENLKKLITGELPLYPQNGEPSYFSKRSEKDGAINWQQMDVYQIYNLIRATTHPYPGAFGEIDGKILRIWKARPFDTRICYKEAGYGKVVERFDSAFVINCLGGTLLVEEWSEI